MSGVYRCPFHPFGTIGVVVLLLFFVSLAWSQSSGGTVSAAQAVDGTRTNQKPNSPQQWGLSDKIAVIASVVAFLQFLALVWTVWVMIVNGRRQLRAYVAPESAGVFEGNMLSPPQQNRVNVPGTVMVIKNCGQTPAYRVISWAKIAVILIADEALGLALPNSLERRFSTTLSAGGTFSKSLWFDRPLTQNEISDIATGTRAIYLYGRVEYEDAFQTHHFTNFRLHYIGQFPPQPDTVLGVSTEGNSAS